MLFIMKLNVPILLSISGLVFAGLQKQTDPSGCHADNCLRAIRATSQLPQASLDCSSFVEVIATPPPVSVTVISTITAPVKRDATLTGYYGSIPTYASACTDADEYSSACFCIGVTPSTTTLAAASTTVTTIVTATACAGETCATGFVPICDPENTNCYCFTNTEGEGFCGENAPCSSLTECETDYDCAVAEDPSGDTCALSTCCGSTGYCLVGMCSNPASKLARMAIAVAKDHLGVDTAAFRAH